ncbi:MAG: CehA/McbA family metallohydrolase [Planctomycetales bacterium]
MRTLLLSCLLIACIATTSFSGEVQFDVRDSGGKRLPCRIHLLTADGKPVKTPGQLSYRDHFVCPGTAKLELTPGAYRYEIERGPEHDRARGDFTLQEGEPRKIQAALARIADLSQSGWYSGDLHVHRKIEDVPLLMQAEDLRVAGVITWWNKNNLWKNGVPADPLRSVDGRHWYHILGGEDERGGGALLYFHLPKPLEITTAEREYPSATTFLRQSKAIAPHSWADIEKPFWWDVPIWLATGQVDSIGLANNHMCRSEMYPSEAWGKPRDTKRLPPPLGNGYWTQEIYYHMLNCGLRVPPSAGSASGVLPNSVGYNRVYVQCGEKFDYQQWWENLRQGKSFVTNGPLLLVKADGQLPGHVFTVSQPQEIDLKIQVISLDRITKVEIISNGEVVKTLDATDARDQTFTTKLPVNGAGWFLVRGIADNPRTFRFASTAPFYADAPNQAARISRASVQFFQTWIEERSAQLVKLLPDETQRREVLAHVEAAARFWQAKLAQANAP